MIPLLLLLLTAHVAAFSFTVPTWPSQCSNLTLEWSGGVPPYEITIVPIAQINISTPLGNLLSANTTSTTFTTPLLFPQGSQISIVLSDATGFGTGGTSDIYTVGNGTSTCLLPTTLTPPTFAADIEFDQFTQCSNALFLFSGSYVAPITVTAVEIGGNSWEMSPIAQPAGAAGNVSDVWTIDVQEGTELVLVVGDATGRATGGFFPLFTVGTGNTTSCMSSASTSSSSHTGAIIGGVIGGVVALLLLTLLSCILWRRFLITRRRARNKSQQPEKAIGLKAYPFAGYKAEEDSRRLIGHARTPSGYDTPWAAPAGREEDDNTGKVLNSPVLRK